jgi:hypothetical protein
MPPFPDRLPKHPGAFLLPRWQAAAPFEAAMAVRLLPPYHRRWSKPHLNNLNEKYHKHLNFFYIGYP